MGNGTGSTAIWDVKHALRRMGAGHYERYRDTCRRVGVMGNALAGIQFQSLYHDPAREILAAVRANVERPGMTSEELLSTAEQQACVAALHALDAALEAQPATLSLYQLCTEAPEAYPGLAPLFNALHSASPRVCVPFVQAGFDPAVARPSLDEFLGLVGDYSYIDLYERPPALDWKPVFNRTMVRAKRAGLLVELRGLRKPAAPCYVSDPADDRWDVRSCVPPENAVLFKDVHMKINTMAYVAGDLAYGDFFDRPMAAPEVLPHFKARVQADADYWFTPLERDRIAAALDAIAAFLEGSEEHGTLTFRQVYTDPDVPAEILIQFQRILDVKPEICLPFMNHTWDHAEAATAIDVFLTRNRDRSLKQLYTGASEPPRATYTQSEFELRMQQREATKLLLSKSNDLICESPGNCIFEPDDYCSTDPFGNCVP